MQSENKVLIGEHVTVGSGSKILKNSVIGNNVTIGENCEISDSVIFEGSILEPNSTVIKSIIGWRSKIGNGSQIQGCVFDQDVRIGKGVHLEKVTVCSHKSVNIDLKETIVL